MNTSSSIAILRLCCLALVSTAFALQETVPADKQEDIKWSRKDDGRIRLATPPMTKDGRVRGNLNVVADRVKAAMKSDDIQKLYTMSDVTELEVTVVLKSGDNAAVLARLLLADLYDIILDSDVQSCRLVFLHGERWVENRPTISERKLGPVVFEMTISAKAIHPAKNAG